MITARSLSVSFGRRVVLDEGSFDIPAGRVAVFVGANGSGKTTTLRALTGLIPSRESTSSLNGRDREGRLGVSLGPDSLPGAVTVGRFLALGTRRGLEDHAPALLAATGLEDVTRRRISRLSTGMRQKVALIGALRHRPSALVLDEPHNGLDPQSIDWLHTELRAARDRGASVLVSSHLLREVAQVADMAFEMRDGHVTRIAWPPPNISGDNGMVTVESAEAERLVSLLAADGYVAALKRTSLLETEADTRVVLATANRAGIALDDLRATTPLLRTGDPQ